MKKILVSLSLVLVAMVALTSCEINGTHFYKVGPANDTSYALNASYDVKYASRVSDALVANGFINDIDGIYIMDGNRYACDKKIKLALNRIMDEIESEKDYNSLLVVKGLEMQIKYFDIEHQDQENVIFSRIFK